MARVTAGHGGVAQPVTADQDDQHQEQRGGDHPDHLRERAQANDVNGQRGTGDGASPGFAAAIAVKPYCAPLKSPGSAAYTPAVTHPGPTRRAPNRVSLV